MYKIAILLILSILLLHGCADTGPGNVSPADKDSTSAGDVDEITDEAPVKERFERKIGDSKGVVTLSQTYGENDTVKIYNADGSIWYEFSYYDDAAFDQLESINTEFRPFAFHPDYLILGLRVTGEDDKRYEVVVNEEDGLKKFVRKDDKVLEYEPFEKHILSTYAIDFDSDKNPVLDEPEGKKVTEDYSKVAIFKAVQVSGDWVELKWSEPTTKADANTNETQDEREKTGWVRWRKDGTMLIELFYVA